MPVPPFLPLNSFTLFLHIWLLPAPGLSLSISTELCPFIHSFIHAFILPNTPCLPAGDMAVAKTAWPCLLGLRIQ